MPTETELKELFASMSAPSELDAKRIIARSRARRLPKQIGAGAIGTFAVAGLTVVGVQSLQVAPPISSTMDQEYAPEASSGMDSAIKMAPAEKINGCGGALAEVSPSFYGLQLDVTFPSTAPVGTEPIAGTVRLTNTSDTRVTGTTAPIPALTLSQDGLVLWHSNGPMIMSLAVVDLGPGESMEYSTSFTPVVCSPEVEGMESFPDDLPAAPAGEYELSAIIYFSPDASMVQTGTTELDVVSGPLSSITLQ